jgi:hypothetical protein
MGPLAAIYHPGGDTTTSYPVCVIDFITTWSEQTGAVTEVVCVTTDGAIHTFNAHRVQIVDRAVAESIVRASAAVEQQREEHGTVPPLR